MKVGPLLSESQGADLTRAVTIAEIKEAIDGIGNDKSPGPDGYSSMFYKKAWGTVGASVVAAVMEFFHTGKLLKEINHTVLALIPKSSFACEVGDFRPIACCNILYKMRSFWQLGLLVCLGVLLTKANLLLLVAGIYQTISTWLRFF